MKSALLRGFLALAGILMLAAPNARAAEVKLGFVDQQRGILSTTRGREARKSLEALADQKKQQMEPRQQEFLSKQEQLETQRFVLSREALEEQALELEQEKRELERELTAARDDLAVQERKMLKPVIDRWERAVQEIGKQKGFDVIIDRSTPGILFYQDALDITDLVIQRVNAME